LATLRLFGLKRGELKKIAMGFKHPHYHLENQTWKDKRNATLCNQYEKYKTMHTVPINDLCNNMNYFSKFVKYGCPHEGYI
jgi:hypothetical protein